LFTLTRLRPYGLRRAVYFLCHCPSDHPARALPGALPFGVRTFLPPSRQRRYGGRSSSQLRHFIVACRSRFSVLAFLVPSPFRLLEPLSHLLVVVADAGPTDGVPVPTVVPDSHVDAAVDEELHRLVRVRQEDEVVEDARRLVRVPIGVDVCAVLEQVVCDGEMTVDDGPRERGVENMLLRRRAPLEVVVFQRVWVVTGKMLLEIAQRRRAGRVEPALHPREVADASRMRQIVGHRPDAGE